MDRHGCFSAWPVTGSQTATRKCCLTSLEQAAFWWLECWQKCFNSVIQSNTFEEPAYHASYDFKKSGSWIFGAWRSVRSFQIDPIIRGRWKSTQWCSVHSTSRVPLRQDPYDSFSDVSIALSFSWSNRSGKEIPGNNGDAVLLLIIRIYPVASPALLSVVKVQIRYMYLLHRLLHVSYCLAV